MRVISLLLTLLMAAFPAAASGMAGQCTMDHCGQHVTSDAADACCGKHQSASKKDPSEGSPAASSCPKCMHACCRTPDVVHTSVGLIPDRVMVSPLLAPVASVHDPLTCSAIFHPPRA